MRWKGHKCWVPRAYKLLKTALYTVLAKSRFKTTAPTISLILWNINRSCIPKSLNWVAVGREFQFTFSSHSHRIPTWESKRKSYKIWFWMASQWCYYYLHISMQARYVLARPGVSYVGFLWEFTNDNYDFHSHFYGNSHSHGNPEFFSLLHCDVN